VVPFDAIQREPFVEQGQRHPPCEIVYVPDAEIAAEAEKG
jgi:hypothetical protein